MRVLLITTGGTIDGADIDTGRSRDVSALREYLLLDNQIELVSHSPFNKDSREILISDRELIATLIENSSADRVLIGHGTFTICETGRFLKTRLNTSRRIILLVGSWIPFGEPSSDAPDQVKNALQALKNETTGLYISMDGRLWNPDTTDKVATESGGWKLTDR